MKTLFEPMLNGLFTVAQCPVLMRDKDGNILFKKLPRGGVDLLSEDPAAFEKAVELVRALSTPVLLSDDQEIGGYFFPDSSALIVGPLKRKHEQKETFDLRKSAINTQLESIAFAARRLVEDHPDGQQDIYEDVFEPVGRLKHLLPQWVDVVMEDSHHSSFAYELCSSDAITQGEPERYCSVHQRQRNGQDGVLGYNKLRSSQNLAICGVVLNSRAAIAGGLSVEQGYTLADYFILGIENCKNAKDAHELGFISGIVFARMVRNLKQKIEQKQPPSHLSKQALELIRRYIFIKVDRKTIAKDLKVNEDYLDRVLKADFNLTAIECLRNERIEEAKRMLIQTQTPIYEIASLLLFAHSSHFSKVFKSVTGVTPKAYRERKLTFVASATI